MADVLLAGVLRDIYRLAALPTEADVPDVQLLEGFASGDQQAAEILLRRHGPLVWRVCRRVLGASDRADDAFQATFLVLAAKARSIRKPTSLASWLHGVAYRIARRARIDYGRPGAIAEKRAAAEVDPSQEAAWRELTCIIEEEVAALPEKLRGPILLCYWEGKTNEEAARQLRLPCGTVKSRLLRAREMLRRCLTRRGVALPAGVIALLLAPGTAETVPPTVVTTLAQALAGISARKIGVNAGASPFATSLAEGVVRGMAIAKIKTVFLLTLTLGLLAGGAGTVAWQASASLKEKRDQRIPQVGAAHSVQEGLTQVAQMIEQVGGEELTKPDTRKPLLDLYGDALPSGAIARLGTSRFRNGMFKPCFFPDQKTLMTASRHSLQFWEAATGRLLRDIPTGLYIHRTALSPDGKRAATAGIILEPPSFRAVVRVWDTVSGKEVRTFAEKGRPVSRTSLAFTADGKILISISNGLVRFEEIASGKELRRLEIHKDILPTFALSPNGETLAIAPGANTWKFHLWNWKTEKEPREFKVPSRPLSCLCFSPDSKTLAVCDQLASRIHIWDVARAKVVRTVDMDKEAVCASDLAFSPDGTLLAVADSGNRKKFSGGLYLWDLKHDRYFRKLLTPGEQVLFTGFSGDSRRAAATTSAGVRVWEVATGRRVADVEDAHGGSLTQIAVSARALVATASYDDTVRLWDLNSGRQKMKLVHGGAVRAAALSPDGERLVTSCMDNSVRLWDLRKGTEQKRLAGHGEFGGWRTVGFTPDGRKFLSWGDDFSLRIVDVKSGKILVEHRVPPASTPTTDIERTVRLEKLLMAGMGPSSFSPNGKYFVLSFRDGFHVFETATGKERQTIPHPGASVTSLAFSADSRCFLASVLVKGGQKEHLILLCELATGKVRRSLVLPGEEPPVAFSADGRLFAVGLNGSPGEVRVYNVAAEPAVASFAGFAGKATLLTFSHDNKLLVSGMDDTSALIWKLPARPPMAATDLEPAALRELWADLAGEDAAKAFRAIWALAQSPQTTVPFFQARLQPTVAPDPGKVAQLLRDLNSDHFVIRGKATRELERLGELAENALKEALSRKQNLESRRRLERLLSKLKGPITMPEKVRGIRAVETLEYIGTPEARKLLENLARGAPEALVTQEAKESLTRIRR